MKRSALRLGLDRAHRLDNSRLHILILLRWYALLGVSVTLLVAWWLDFQGIGWSAMFLFVILGVACNLMLSSLPSVPHPDSFQSIYHLQLVLDISALSGLLWASGGLNNPFSNLFLLHVVVAALIGTRTSVILAGSLASIAAIILHILARKDLLLGTFSPPPMLNEYLHLAALLVDAASIAAVVGLLSARFQAREARLTEARQQVKLREQVLERVVSGLSVAVEVIRDHEVIWQNEAMQSIRVLELGGTWTCPGAENGCNRMQASASGACAQPSEGEAHSCLVRIRLEGRDRVFRKFSWQLKTEERLETVHLYIDETQRLAEEERLKFTERLASLGRMAQGLAHELNTPLSTVRTLTQDLGAALGEIPDLAPEIRADMEDSLSMSLRELERCARITRGLLQGRGLVGSGRPEEQELEPLVQNAVALVSVGSRRQHPFILHPGSATAFIDADVFIQVLVNLLSNAVDASPPGTGIELQLIPQQEQVVVEVADRGTGLHPDIRPHLFEPFATTKPVGQGTGLGLYMVRRMLAEVRGTLELVDREGGGTTARVTLQRYASSLAV